MEISSQKRLCELIFVASSRVGCLWSKGNYINVMQIELFHGRIDLAVGKFEYFDEVLQFAQSCCKKFPFFTTQI